MKTGQKVTILLFDPVLASSPPLNLSSSSISSQIKKWVLSSSSLSFFSPVFIYLPPSRSPPSPIDGLLRLDATRRRPPPRCLLYNRVVCRPSTPCPLFSRSLPSPVPVLSPPLVSPLSPAAVVPRPPWSVGHLRCKLPLSDRPPCLFPCTLLPYLTFLVPLGLSFNIFHKETNPLLLPLL